MLDRNLILENERVVLRPITREQCSLLEMLTQDPEMWTYFTYDLSIPEEFEKWVAPALSSDRLQFVVYDKTNDSIVGSTAVGNFSARDQRIEIGWTWLAKEARGSGINQAMKHLMCAYCFETLRLKRVEFKTDVLNIPARKALLNFGAVEEGVLRSHTLLTQQRRRDTIFYSILENEWPIR